jgi:hypothetical protein
MKDEPAPVKRGPKPGGPKKQRLKKGELAPSRGSSRIQRIQEERKHTAWKDVHVVGTDSSPRHPRHPSQFETLSLELEGTS